MTALGGLVWPTKPLCHGRGGADLTRLTGSKTATWDPANPRRVYGRDSANLSARGTLWRECSFCGSINPEDLYHYLQGGSTYLQQVDWAGWETHKYVVAGLPNAHAGMIVQYGSNLDGSTMWGASPPRAPSRFYVIHFLCVTHPATFRAFADAIEYQIPGTHWDMAPNGVTFRSAHLSGTIYR